MHQLIFFIAEGIDKEVKMKMTEFLKTPMQGKIIKDILLPPLSHCCAVKTYKVWLKLEYTNNIKYFTE